MKLKPEEARLEGHWEYIDNQAIPDATCNRIEKLITEHLRKIGVDDSGWDTLYLDPRDGRYWELIYLSSGMHGGGPPSLIQINRDMAEVKYRKALISG